MGDFTFDDLGEVNDRLIAGKLVADELISQNFYDLIFKPSFEQGSRQFTKNGYVEQLKRLFKDFHPLIIRQFMQCQKRCPKLSYNMIFCDESDVIYFFNCFLHSRANKKLPSIVPGAADWKLFDEEEEEPYAGAVIYQEMIRALLSTFYPTLESFKSKFLCRVREIKYALSVTHHHWSPLVSCVDDLLGFISSFYEADLLVFPDLLLRIVKSVSDVIKVLAHLPTDHRHQFLLLLQNRGQMSDLVESTDSRWLCATPLTDLTASYAPQDDLADAFNLFIKYIIDDYGQRSSVAYGLIQMRPALLLHFINACMVLKKHDAQKDLVARYIHLLSFKDCVMLLCGPRGESSCYSRPDNWVANARSDEEMTAMLDIIACQDSQSKARNKVVVSVVLVDCFHRNPDLKIYVLIASRLKKLDLARLNIFYDATFEKLVMLLREDLEYHMAQVSPGGGNVNGQLLSHLADVFKIIDSVRRSVLFSALQETIMPLFSNSQTSSMMALRMHYYDVLAPYLDESQRKEVSISANLSLAKQLRLDSREAFISYWSTLGQSFWGDRKPPGCAQRMFDYVQQQECAPLASQHNEFHAALLHCQQYYTVAGFFGCRSHASSQLNSLTHLHRFKP